MARFVTVMFRAGVHCMLVGVSRYPEVSAGSRVGIGVGGLGGKINKNAKHMGVGAGAV